MGLEKPVLSGGGVSYDTCTITMASNINSAKFPAIAGKKNFLIYCEDNFQHTGTSVYYIDSISRIGGEVSVNTAFNGWTMRQISPSTAFSIDDEGTITFELADIKFLSGKKYHAIGW